LASSSLPTHTSWITGAAPAPTLPSPLTVVAPLLLLTPTPTPRQLPRAVLVGQPLHQRHTRGRPRPIWRPAAWRPGVLCLPGILDHPTLCPRRRVDRNPPAVPIDRSPRVVCVCRVRLSAYVCGGAVRAAGVVGRVLRAQGPRAGLPGGGDHLAGSAGHLPRGTCPHATARRPPVRPASSCAPRTQQPQQQQ
jgi:hypothetical protein